MIRRMLSSIETEHTLPLLVLLPVTKNLFETVALGLLTGVQCVQVKLSVKTTPVIISRPRLRLRVCKAVVKPRAEHG